MKQKLVSIIVPIYNVESYLSECIESLLNQSYTNLEIILVNDGSTDSSGELCEKYKEKDKRICVIHKENGGLSDARNAGLLQAKGEYVIFIDSDDYVNLSMVEKLYIACQEQQADIGVCYFERIYDGQKPQSINDDKTPQRQLYAGRDVVKKIYQGEGESIAFNAWNKIYKKELFLNHNILYPVGRIHEDMYTTFQLLCLAPTVVILPEALYYYRIRNSSIMTTKLTSKKCIDCLDSYICAIEYYSSVKDNDLLYLGLNAFFREAVFLYRTSTRSLEKKEKMVCKQYLKEKYTAYWNRYHKNMKRAYVKYMFYKGFGIWLKLFA